MVGFRPGLTPPPLVGPLGTALVPGPLLDLGAAAALLPDLPEPLLAVLTILGGYIV